MPPKNKFTKEQIIETAFEIAKEEGIDSITIRKIADNLGSSIAPIYVNFKDVEELKEAVISKIYEIGNSILQEQNTGDVFLNIGIASVKFAKDYSVIFKDLILKNNGYLDNYDEQLGNNIIQEMKKDEDLKEFSEEELKTLLMKMQVFQAGLSIMATNESFALKLTDEKIIEMLSDTGEDIVNGMKNRRLGR
ncbi:transcriptional regulator, TetR family [Anaerosporobacter mobilis DSM 15930]|uniref:Transcriptional regulator, TetR family n=1 Tax=Anaerosporobacter mobilis DSM 15930 TaxID=1120996 RepID=A0A1M7FSZ8_9FIRM|nr:TetR/AcrR family transcriptional regulator [Anaerosporobacter mobilis]SHM07252.1 transcriptional regulator, TetR family [Anaerosporobacter mobilis DSM 15930]